MGKVKLCAPFEAYYGNVGSKKVSSANYATGIPHYLRICNRKAANNEGIAKSYTMWPGMRTTKPSSTELARRATFAANAAKVVARMQSITASAQDMAAAREAGMTYRAYVWSLALSGELDD